MDSGEFMVEDGERGLGLGKVREYLREFESSEAAVGEK